MEFINVRSLVDDASVGKTAVGSMYGQLLKDCTEEPSSRFPYLRPSMLPLCSLTMLETMYQFHLQYDQSWGFMSDYFTSVGTQVHTLIETWSGRNGRMWGNWRCVATGCKGRARHTAEQECPKCGAAMRYREITIQGRGFKGHIDCLIELPCGSLALGDYKTSSTYKVRSAKFVGTFPRPYVLQIMTYALLVEEKFNRRVKTISLLFVPRDNPSEFKEIVLPWNMAKRREVAQFLTQQRTAFKAAKKSFITSDLSYALEARNCKTNQDYQDKMAPLCTYEPCPLHQLCVGSRPTDKKFKQLRAHMGLYEHEAAEHLGGRRERRALTIKPEDT